MQEYVKLLEDLIRLRPVSEDVPAVNRATELIRKIDPEAFLTVTKIREVHGRGFIEE